MDTALPNASQNRSHTFAKMSTQCCDFRMKAGNGLWQHLLGRMSQNSWLRTDAEVGALGARQEVGTGASSPSSEGGWTGTITHNRAGAWARALRPGAEHEDRAHVRQGKAPGEEFKKKSNRCQFLGPSHTSLPLFMVRGQSRPPNTTTHHPLPGGAAHAN